jgi:AraC family transcriptional regulator, transcriptional activator of pobA
MQDTLTLINPLNGNLAFKIFSFEDNYAFDHVQRVNYYSLIWIKSGIGKCKVDFSEFDVTEKTLFAFSPYQPFMFSFNEKVEGIAIQFHPDFYCIHMHQKEVACNGVLFNNIYEPPFTNIDVAVETSFHLIIDQMKTEMQNPALAQYELLVSYLKIFLINASRLKTQQQPEVSNKIDGLREPFILQDLKEAIEKDFKVKHSASDYADVLNISANALAKIVKTYFNKTLTDLISERIIIEAKRELYLTNKSVKEIAFELGYNDEHYFSRFFKNNADVSPQMYRDTVGFGRG